ncbi:MAG TPA: NAD-dependent epimerase/dehydratase family protein [Polyangium sp.]|nr:NAD-dependent epimerase/dehydratase family protein [Polyangium sp.]
MFDNFLTGTEKHLASVRDNPRLTVVRGDIREPELLTRVIAGHDIVYHFASNADIAQAVVNPDIDFDNGTLLCRNVLEAMRKTGVRRIRFTSGSGVYGDIPPTPIPEDWPTMIPVSTYGAGKLAAEALISAYCFMFDFEGTVFRFANVVGPRQTHGVGYDFVRKLRANPQKLLILGDGSQSKPYIHVFDVLDAFALLERERRAPYEYFNVGTTDHITVREIADIVVRELGLSGVNYEYTGGARGWKGDVPVYRLDTSKIRARGWASKYTSEGAVTDAIRAMIGETAREEKT